MYRSDGVALHGYSLALILGSHESCNLCTNGYSTSHYSSSSSSKNSSSSSSSSPSSDTSNHFLLLHLPLHFVFFLPLLFVFSQHFGVSFVLVQQTSPDSQSSQALLSDQLPLHLDLHLFLTFVEPAHSLWLEHAADNFPFKRWMKLPVPNEAFPLTLSIFKAPLAVISTVSRLADRTSFLSATSAAALMQRIDTRASVLKSMISQGVRKEMRQVLVNEQRLV